MASSKHSKGSSQPNDSFPTQPDTSEAEAALRAKLSRKRTKTGCLTCRRRRIKCGEERPICRNCIKSKRNCEGYNQRVVFKPPSFDFQPGPHGGTHITFQAGPALGPAIPWAMEYGHAAAPQPDQQQPMFFFGSGQQQQYGFHPQEPQYQPQQPTPPANQVPQTQIPMQYRSEGTTLSQHNLPLHNTSLLHSTTPGWEVPGGAPMYPSGSMQFSPQVPTPRYAPTDWPPAPTMKQEQSWETVPPTPLTMPPHESPSSSHSSRTLAGSHPTAFEGSPQPWLTNGHVPRPELCRPVDYRPPPAPPQPIHQQYTHHQTSIPPHYDAPEFYEHEDHAESSRTPTRFLQQAAVETYDDEYYDVKSDEELVSGMSLAIPGEQNLQLSFQSIINANNIVIQDPQTRRYDTFIYPGMLDRYRPDEVANPLNNEATARLFFHFVAVTGPMLSIYERQVRNTSMLFTEGQIPFSQQGLWTYTMPQVALKNKGLLHAMLALASLHVARLTNASDTPSYQHYAWALKRIHSSVAREKQRYAVPTIAASMLLGFYEVMTADHVKWNTHLMGAKQLFLETDFCTMTKQFRRMKEERAGPRNGKRKYSNMSQTQGEILDQIHDVDERLVSELSGREVKYDAHGQILTASETIPKPLDLHSFEILRDLYWWFLKQDAYQSIISGNPPMHNYNRWTDCPPRAPLGKADAVYGTFDHLILLLGRIADFSARDRTRKLRVMEANGGQWRPPQATNIPGLSQAAPPTPVSAGGGQPPSHPGFSGPPPAAANPPEGPQFFGMAPPPRQNVQMPSSYRNLHTNKIPTPEAASPQDFVDLNAATQAAMQEYGRIRTALFSFSSKLGDRFKPLTADYQPPLATPFGSALFYRSYDIGCIWAIYHMAMIMAIRSHPNMPPAAHAAAAVAAGETHFFANEIGRITAGIAPTSLNQSLNPGLGAALSESSMATFFAAIQYQDAEQRRYTVERLKDIAQLTGWGSTELIANGCETAWVKAAAAGRGPPYTRIARKVQSDDPRLNGSWEHLDPNMRPVEQDKADRRLVPTEGTARLSWAIGIMGTEEDEVVKGDG
ncbi:uncharacterized protein LTR77_010783 [Saxophila tyrrhenica]|uniref:Zn(2)-C6 fungal-type domain-containing protein n=1 Tax=Saxophila tyrrhenica TaxID=1690608 RepID=A0AAV9NVZ5_9PEZI|nr:hypothetical protein LTR77_010783 [Saxophila tyrrhenica]